ncbi:MAG: DNA-binding protein [Caldiserica bacterium]|nr:MAG: DNA-binding protein [Caldisericota bacterium]
MNKRFIEAERWFRQAKESLKAAKDLKEKGHFNWVCFIAQQSAEFAIKAVYELRGEPVEWIHSLTVLIKGDKKRGISGIKELLDCIESAKLLDKVYIPTRYVNSVPYGAPFEFYDKGDAEECLLAAEKILKSVKRLLST